MTQHVSGGRRQAEFGVLQFAVILDFMIVAPLGALVMPALDMSPRDFGFIVSAYAFSAGARVAFE